MSNIEVDEALEALTAANNRVRDLGEAIAIIESADLPVPAIGHGEYAAAVAVAKAAETAYLVEVDRLHYAQAEEAFTRHADQAIDLTDGQK
jgi:hypothetical protein